MDYVYLASKFCNPDINILDIYGDLNAGKLFYICYHITSKSKYPFVQIMLLKQETNVDVDINVKDEEFGLPFVVLNKECPNIASLVIRNIKNDLKKIKCDTLLLTEKSYKGIFSDKMNTYALIDISCINILCQNSSKISSFWFGLPTEIINIGSICNIPVSKDVIKLFTYVMPELGVVYKPNSKDPYLLPDIVYTGSDYKKAEFRTLFGPSKKGTFMYFCKSFLEAIKSIKSNNETTAVNRYAIFLENPMVAKIDNVEKLSHEEIDFIGLKYYYMYNCIIVEDWKILVRSFDLFYPLSYHAINPDNNCLS